MAWTKAGESPGAAFLRRREERRVEHQIKTRTVLGFVLGSMLLLLSFSKLYLSPTNWPQFFGSLELAGFVVLITTLVIPQLLFPIESTLRLIGTKIGEWVLWVALGSVYLTIVTPIGLVMRVWRGTAPIYSWTAIAPSGEEEGWSRKSVNTIVRGDTHGGGARTGLVGVISFFIKRGKILLLPAVMILIAFGLALYFVKTSVLAPFIYTLF